MPGPRGHRPFLVPGIPVHRTATNPELFIDKVAPLGERLRQRRRTRGLALAEAAKLIGVRRWTFGFWEKGRRNRARACGRRQPAFWNEKRAASRSALGSPSTLTGLRPLHDRSRHDPALDRDRVTDVLHAALYSWSQYAGPNDPVSSTSGNAGDNSDYSA